MKKLIDKLNQANKEYYQNNREIMSNKEYDELYDQLIAMEKETGIIYSNSPTQKVGYEIKSKLQKVKHSAPVLSLDKTKDIEKLKSWLGDQIGVLSWKLDGLTVVLDYENGQLARAVTRGNGSEGEDITHNAKVFKNLPLTIPYKEKLQLRGEALISYEDFEMINMDGEYKNPRNLASGSIRQLDSNIAAQRQLRFVAFECVTDVSDIVSGRLFWLKEQGFDVVDHIIADYNSLENDVNSYFRNNVKDNPYPSDGLVLILDDIAYGKSLGKTSKFPHNAIAFKWSDSVVESTLLGIEWQVSRTGQINPVAVFKPVEIDGSTVNKASVHNLSIIEELELGVYDVVTVMKCNMIIPQIDENLTRSNNIPIPTQCPVCGYKTEIRQLKDSKVLYCTNDKCPAKLLQSFVHFVGRDAMNIEGLSVQTLEKFINKGFLHDFSDIYKLSNYESEIKTMDGFGVRSYNRLIESIEKSKDAELYRLVYALGISHVGRTASKALCKRFNDDIVAIMGASVNEYLNIDGFGEKISCSINEYFSNLSNINLVRKLLEYVNIKEEKVMDIKGNSMFNGKKIYATGVFQNYRKNEIQAILESFGATFASGYAKSLDYLIEGSLKSSTKVDKARKDGIPVLSEKEFMDMIS